jgi:S1-C subfamily serine protease
LPHKTTNGIGFAMPLDTTTREKIDQLKRGQPVLHGYLGVAVRDRVGGGVTVTTVGPSTPADGVLRTGDVITRIDGRGLDSETDFIRAVSTAAVDRPVAFVVERGGREVPMSLQLDARQHTVAGVNRASQRIFWRGLTLGLPEGMASGGVQVLAIDPLSPMVNQGIRAGTIIKQVAGQPVSDLLTLQSLIDATPTELCKLDIAPGSTSARTAYATGSE